MGSLHESIRSRQVTCAGLSVHVLECGEVGRDVILLLHGFPELAYSWRKVLPLLAQAGYHVVAPDMRGYGKTVPLKSAGPTTFDQSLAGFGMIDTISEMTALVHTLHAETHPAGTLPQVKVVIGHDMGSAVASTLALARPDIFKSLIMMSAPFAGAPSLSADDAALNARKQTLTSLSLLDPPRKHYQLHFCGHEANNDLLHAKQGLAQFYRGYYYYKSGLWHENKPHKLGDSWTVERLTQLPEYYVMQASKTMSQTVHDALADVAADDMAREMKWMSDAELSYYVSEFSRTGFQGGLNHYRVRVGGLDNAQLSIFSSLVIQVPCTFISGASDWGNYQDPGGIDKMQSEAVVQKGMFKGCVFVPGAGHWVQQEQPKQTVEAILSFLQTCFN